MYEFLKYVTGDVMTAPPVTIASKASLAEAERVFEDHDFNALPVVAENGELLGIVTKLDLLRAFRFTEEHLFPPYEEIMQGPVEAVMTRAPITLTPRTPLTRALEKMLATRNKSLPVVENGRLVGMLAREDVLRALRRAVGGERPHTPI